MANYVINPTIAHGKYTEKIDSSHLTQVYLETGDSQVLTEAAITIAGTTYPAGTTLSSILSTLSAGGALYQLVAGSTADVVKIQKSTDGGTTWSDVSSVTVNNVAAATAATNDGSGNVITTTYATKTELQNVDITTNVNSGKQSDGSTDITGTKASGVVTLGDSGVTAGTYSALQVNAKGIVVDGAQMVVFATSTSDSRLDSLANGGIGIIYEN